MSDFTVRRIDEMETYYLGAMKRARAELGVTSFGIQVMDLPPNLTVYPEHDHAESGQEEVYVPLSGSGEIELDGERHPLEPGVMMRLIGLGGVPGGGYEAPEVTELGQPDPMAGG